MRVFTTGQAAKILKCSPATVNRMFDRKELMGHIVGKRDRRIPEQDLRQYMIQKGIPTDILNGAEVPECTLMCLEERVSKLEEQIKQLKGANHIA